MMSDERKFIIARWAYSVGMPIISDAEYTTLLRHFEATRPDWEYVNRSWSSDPCPVEILKEEGREDLISAVTLTDKTESIPSLNSWGEVADTLSNAFDEKVATISYKHDGWNVQTAYYNGQLISVNTRGRSSDALDVSVLKPLFPQTIPCMGKVKIISECTVSKELFLEMKEKFGNAVERSAVRTALANDGYATRLSVHSFDIIGYPCDNTFPTLTQWGFKVPAWTTVTSYDQLLEEIKRFSDNYPSYDFPTDGLVVAFGNKRHAIRVLTWEEPVYYSYVTGYEESYGPHNISMKVLIKPVHTSTGMQYRLPMTNIARIIEYNLQIGYPIAFNVVSGAIADFNPDATRLIQDEYATKEDVFREKIERNEYYYDYMANS